MRPMRRFHGAILKVWWCLKNQNSVVYLFVLIIFSLKLQIPLSLENETVTLHEWVISVFRWQTTMLFFTKFSEKTLSKNTYVLCECMYRDVCTGKCVHYFLFEYDLHSYQLASCWQSSESVVCFFVGTSEALAVTRHQNGLCQVRKLRTREV